MLKEIMEKLKTMEQCEVCKGIGYIDCPECTSGKKEDADTSMNSLKCKYCCGTGVVQCPACRGMKTSS
jgi:hypothetical protein